MRLNTNLVEIKRFLAIAMWGNPEMFCFAGENEIILELEEVPKNGTTHRNISFKKVERFFRLAKEVC